MKKPLISVILGTYNPVLEHLEKAIKSIINQSYSNWEMWLCDDGSDKEMQIGIKELSKIDNRIHYMRNVENKGLAFSLNRCLKHSKGEFIARMDDDDYSTEDRFECQVNFLMHNTEYSWVGSLAYLFDETGIWGYGRRIEIPDKKAYLKYSPYIHPSVMFRKSVFDNAGVYCTKKTTLRCEDYELFMRFTALGFRGYNIQEELFWYRESSKHLNRKLKYCINEMLIRIQGFYRMKIGGCRSFIYVFKPIIVYLMAQIPAIAQFIRVRKPDGNCKTK